jgi:integrase
VRNRPFERRIFIVERGKIEHILEAIPVRCLRDRLFFRLLLETGLRVSEGLSLYVEALDLSLDNEHLTVVGTITAHKQE